MVSIPILVANAGAAAWASLALGQAIGTATSIFVSFGWGTTGPTQIAISSPAERVTIYSNSLRVRSILAAPGVVIAGTVTYFSAVDSRTEAVVTAVAFTLFGLLGGWFFTGASRPMGFLLFDTIPRVSGTLGGMIALTLGAPLIAFPILQLAGIGTGAVAAAIAINRSDDATGVSGGSSLLYLLKSQSHGLAISGVSAAYISVPITIIAVVAPAALPMYALADKILRYSTTVFSPIVQFLQGWVPGSEDVALFRRIRFALFGGSTLVTTAMAMFILLLPWVANVLSHGTIAVSLQLSIPFGLMLGLFVMGQIVGLACLLALGRAREIATFTIVGAATALPAVFFGSAVAGAEGVAWALVISETVAVGLQLILLLRLVYRPRR